MNWGGGGGGGGAPPVITNTPLDIDEEDKSFSLLDCVELILDNYVPYRKGAIIISRYSCW